MDRRKKVVIVGFAPDTRMEVTNYYEDPDFDIWGLNELYGEIPDIGNKATAWFQLHGNTPPTVRDANAIQNLAALKCPVYLWKTHPDIPNSVAYPRLDILRHFDIYGEGIHPELDHERYRAYFTNSISWMIALAIRQKYKEIHVVGVNMAQDQEFGHQRPSCEFFLGFARGRDIKVYLPTESDLLMSWMLYGYDDGNPMYAKLYAREQELDQRITEMQQQKMQAQAHIEQMNTGINQMQGAKDNVKYLINLGPVGISSDISETKEPAEPSPSELMVIGPLE